MEFEGRYEYKKALILTPERIDELEKILLKYCEKVSYKGTTVAETEISFASKDELLHYDNFRKRKLQSLTIVGGNKYERVITCEFEAGGLGFFVGYTETCVCRYIVSTVDMETTVREDLQTFLKKATARFWALGKIRLTGVLFACCLLAISYSWNVRRGSVGLSIGPFLLASGTGILTAHLTILFDKLILKELFPPLSFLWGEEVARGKRMDTLRGNLLWVVLVGVLIAIFGPKVYEIIF